MAPPRRKACAECVSAKRRCDLLVPSCSRCMRQNLGCIYPSRGMEDQSVPIGTTYSTPLIDPSEFGGIMADIVPLPVNPLRGSLERGFDDLVTTENMPQVTTGYSNEQYRDLIPHFNPITPLPGQVHPSNHTARVIASRLQFAIDRLQEVPRTMILENQTPWCHPQLYRNYMPRSMQDAHACCALYIAKNTINAPIIMTSIESRIADLLDAPKSSTPLEALARAQALVLYQIIRLFDGNIQARMAGESIMPVLETAALDILQYIHFPDPSVSEFMQTEPMDMIIDFWPTWVFQESARRTFLISFFFIQLYRTLRGEQNLQCDGRLGLYHAWYLSSYLWNAQSAFDFAIAWREKRHFLVTDTNIGEVLLEAEPEYYETFGKILLVGFMGIDRAKAWFYSKGGSL